MFTVGNHAQNRGTIDMFGMCLYSFRFMVTITFLHIALYLSVSKNVITLFVEAVNGSSKR